MQIWYYIRVQYIPNLLNEWQVLNIMHKQAYYKLLFTPMFTPKFTNQRKRASEAAALPADSNHCPCPPPSSGTFLDQELMVTRNLLKGRADLLEKRYRLSCPRVCTENPRKPNKLSLILKSLNLNTSTIHIESFTSCGQQYAALFCRWYQS